MAIPAPSYFISPSMMQSQENQYDTSNGGRVGGSPFLVSPYSSGGGGGSYGGGSNFAAMTAPQSGAQGNQNLINALSPSLNYGMPQMPTLTQPQISQDAQQYPTFLRNLGEQTSQEAFQRALNTGAASPQTLMHAQDQLNANRLNYMGQAGQAQLGVDKAKNDYLDAYNQLLTQIYGVQAGMRGQDLSFLNNRLSASMYGNRGIQSYGGTPNAIGGGSGGGNYIPMNSATDIGAPSSFVSQGFQSGWSGGNGGYGY